MFVYLEKYLYERGSRFASRNIRKYIESHSYIRTDARWKSATDTIN